jgi:hypothetical protein
MELVTTTRRVTLGCDIGQKIDPTALVAAQCEDRSDTLHYVIRLIERLPLGTSNPQVAARIAEIMGNLQRRAATERLYGRGFDAQLIVDATGVGLPITDLLTERGPSPTACYFTASDKRTETSYRSISIGKAFMVGRLQVLLQSSRIHLPATPESDALSNELLSYEIKVDDNANVQFGAFRTGTHDDFVTALGIAVGIE